MHMRVRVPGVEGIGAWCGSILGRIGICAVGAL